MEKRVLYYVLLLLSCTAMLPRCSKRQLLCNIIGGENLIIRDTQEILNILNTETCDSNIIPISQADIPYTITQPGRYCLIENVTVNPGQDGITVDLDALTLTLTVIDLNGYSIDGNQAGIPMGRNGIIAISSITPPPSNPVPVALSITNGRIGGMTDHGIYIPFGIGLLNIDTISMQTCGNSAGVADAGGIVVGNPTQPLINPRITCCDILGGISTGYGILVINPLSYYITDTAIVLNAKDGLNIENPFAAGIVQRCITIGNNGYGFITTVNNVDGVYADCVALQNGLSGFNVISNFVTFTNCSAKLNNQNGFIVAANSSAMTECNAIANNLSGFLITGNSNDILECVATSNQGDGFTVSGGGDNNQLRDNTATSNGGFGFNAVALANNKFYSNFANNNAVNNYSVNIINVATSPLFNDPINFTANIAD